MLLIVLVVTNVHISIGIDLIAKALLLIISESTLIYSTVFIQRYAKSMLTVLFCLAKVDAMFVLDDPNVGLFYEFANASAGIIEGFVAYEEVL